MRKVIAIGSMFLGILFLSGCGQQPVSEIQTLKSKNQQTINNNTTSNNNGQNSDIISLEQKWQKGGLKNWQKQDFIIPDISVIAPINLLNSFIISSDSNEIKNIGKNSELAVPVYGIISVGEYGKGNLWGSCSITKIDLPQDMSLEQWIQNKWQSVIAKDDCNGKNQPLTDKLMTGETWNDFCKKGANIESKINEKMIKWNSAYIGSSQIISVVVGKNIISFECGQDNSGDLNFENLVEDISKTLDNY